MGIEPHEELDELLNGEDPKPALNAVEETQDEPEQEQPETEAETGDDSEGVEPETVEEVPPTSREEEGQLAALKHERAQRQLLQMQLEQLQRQMQASNGAGKQTEQQIIDPFGMEPDKFTNSINELVSSSVERALAQDRANRSEAEMLERLGPEKFGEVITEFQNLAQRDPSLVSNLRTAHDPGKFVEKAVENARLQAEIGNDPSSYRARIRDELKAEIMAELKGQMQVTQKAAEDTAKRQALPRTIANAGTASPSVNELPDDSLAALLGE